MDMCPKCGHGLNPRVPADFIKAVIDDLNKVSGRGFLYTPGAIRLISARRREGFELEDFKEVHRLLMRWVKAGTYSLRYVRPATAYAPSKFEGYLADAADTEVNNITEMVRRAREAKK